MKNKWIVILGIGVVALFAACGPSATPTFVPAPTHTAAPTAEVTAATTAESTAESTNEAGATNSSLAGTSWQLTSISGTAPIAGTQVTLVFDANTLSGKSCNTYTGSYSASGGKFAVTNLTNTLVSCLQPAGLQDQETGYFNDLRQATSYKINGSTLSIGSAADPSELMFSLTSAPATGTSGGNGTTTGSGPAPSTATNRSTSTPAGTLSSVSTSTP